METGRELGTAVSGLAVHQDSLWVALDGRATANATPSRRHSRRTAMWCRARASRRGPAGCAAQKFTFFSCGHTYLYILSAHYRSECGTVVAR